MFENAPPLLTPGDKIQTHFSAQNRSFDCVALPSDTYEERKVKY